MEKNFKNEIEQLINRSRYREDLLKSIVLNSDPIINFKNDENFLVLAREWNSWYPSTLEVRGGCYFFNINNEIIVIDPGFNTLDIIRRNELDIRLIRHVFVTHFHPDHFENLITLLTRLTSEKNKLILYLNKTTFDQFKIYSRGYTEFIEIKPGMIIKLDFESEKPSYNISVEIGKAFHKEIGGAMNSVGLKFVLESGVKFKIGFIGDTDGSEDYIDSYYDFYKDCKILIAHLGAIHKIPTGYKHLYKEGLERFLKKFNKKEKKEKIFFLGEFGFELAIEDEYKRVFNEIIPKNINYKNLIKIVYNTINSLKELEENHENISNEEFNRKERGYYNFLLQILAEVLQRCIEKIDFFYPTLEFVLPFIIYGNENSISKNKGDYKENTFSLLKPIINEFLNNYSDEKFGQIWHEFLKTLIYQAENLNTCIRSFEETIESWNLVSLKEGFEKFISFFFKFFNAETKIALLRKFTMEMIFCSVNKNLIIEDITKLIEFEVNIKKEHFEQEIIHFTGINPDLENLANYKELKAMIFIFYGYFVLKLLESSPIVRQGKETDGRETICKYYSEEKKCSILPVHPSYKIYFENKDIKIEGYTDSCNHLNKILLNNFNKDWKILVDASKSEEIQEFINVIPKEKCNICLKKEEIEREDEAMISYPIESFLEDEFLKARDIDNFTKYINKQIENAEDILSIFYIVNNKNLDYELINIDIKQLLQKIQYFIETNPSEFNDLVLLNPIVIRYKSVKDFLKKRLEEKNEEDILKLIKFVLSEPFPYKDIFSDEINPFYYKLFDYDDVTNLLILKISNLDIEIIIGLIYYFTLKIKNEESIPTNAFFKFFKKEFIKNLFPLLENPNNFINEFILIDKSDRILNNPNHLGHPFDKYYYHLKNNLKKLIREHKIIYDEKYHLLNLPESIIKIYFDLKKNIKKIDNKIEVKPGKSYIGFHFGESVIVILTLKQTHIDVQFSEPKEKFEDPKNKLKEIVLDSFLFGKNNSRLIIKAPKEISYAIDLISQSFQIKKDYFRINQESS